MTDRDRDTDSNIDRGTNGDKNNTENIERGLHKKHANNTRFGDTVKVTRLKCVHTFVSGGMNFVCIFLNIWLGNQFNYVALVR